MIRNKARVKMLNVSFGFTIQFFFSSMFLWKPKQGGTSSYACLFAKQRGQNKLIIVTVAQT